MSTDLICYEQPINEHIRACLRLDYLFNEAIFYLFRIDDEFIFIFKQIILFALRHN